VSVQAMTRVLEHSKLGGASRMVLLVIANHETEERGAFPSIDRIAKEANVSSRTVFRAIEQARLQGELLIAFKAGPHGTNLYRVLPNETMPLWHGDIHGPQMSPELKELAPSTGSTASSSVGTNTLGFAEWYAAYPRHMKRADALKAYREALRKTDHATLMESARRLASDPHLPDKQHIPYPASWLRAEGWLDEPYPAERSNGHGGRPDPPRPYDPLIAEMEIEEARRG